MLTASESKRAVVSEQVVTETQQSYSQDAPSATEGDFSIRCDQVAKSASKALMSHPHIELAVVEISGQPDALVFHLQCSIYPDKDPSGVMEIVAGGVIPNMERILGTDFISRDLNFSLTPDA